MKIVFPDKEFECTGLIGEKLRDRYCYKISFNISYDELRTYFTDGASYYWENPNEVEGELPYQQDLSEYSIFAGVFINPDNTCEVYMGKKTLAEENLELKAELASKEAIIVEKDALLATQVVTKL